MRTDVNTTIANEVWAEICIAKGTNWLRISGYSMAPLLRPGDQVLASKATPEQMHRGDIAVFRRDNMLIVHRVLKKRFTPEGAYLIEKGDNLEKCGLVNADNIIGKVMVVQRNGRIFSLTTRLNRPISLALSVWFYWTSAIIFTLRTSTHRNVRGLGRILSRLSLASSNFLVRSCFIGWYLSGLGYRVITGSN